MTHRSAGLTAEPVNIQPAVQWGKIQSPEEWLKSQPTNTWKDFFSQNGYLVVKNMINQDELEIYRSLYAKMLSGEIDTTQHRHDLGNHEAQKTSTENICQIMWPSVYVDRLSEGPLHQRARAVSRIILGDDMSFDFDMLISKSAQTDTPTPWHQDESYWPDLPDKRAVSCWCAMDEATVDNGCMWFVGGSHLEPLRDHRPVRPGVHVLTCPGSESEGLPQPLTAGSATFHHGRTMHYTRGNSTDGHRRAFITAFRPGAMVERERELNFDHGKSGAIRMIKTGKTHTAN